MTLQIFRRPATDAPDTNVFQAYGPALTLGPALGGVGLVALGKTASGSVDINSPVSEGDRLVLVACVDRMGGPTPGTAAVLGYISAGLEIA